MDNNSVHKKKIEKIPSLSEVIAMLKHINTIRSQKEYIRTKKTSFLYILRHFRQIAFKVFEVRSLHIFSTPALDEFYSLVYFKIEISPFTLNLLSVMT